MSKILFLVPYPIGKAPSQRFRFEQYFSYLQQHGKQIIIASFWSERGFNILYQKGNYVRKILHFVSGYLRRARILIQINKYDVIFIHREITPLGPPLFEWIITKIFHKNVVYDFDDAIWLPNTSKENRLIKWLKNHQKVANICRWSTKISCGNRFLVNYASQFNSHVVFNPTTINTEYHLPKKKNYGKNVIIGWTGTHSTNKYLHEITDVLIELTDNYNLEIRFISDKDPGLKIKKSMFIQWNKDQEIKQLQSFDIGIMPLKDTIWEQGKCGFKALQYMALEIPAVVSEVGANKDIVDEKSGFLCKNTYEWKTALVNLIESKELRIRMGKEGRKRVINHYSVQSNRSTFLALFE